MPRTYPRCHYCSGEVIERKITVDYRWGDQLLAIIQHVPAGVCQVCREEYFKPEILKEMDRLAHEEGRPEKFLSIPLREMAGK